MEIKGKLIQVLEASSGNSARGTWKRQDFIIETMEQYPKKVCLSNWNDKIPLEGINLGTVINASINIESREYNGKWYTDVRVWKADVEGAVSSNQGGMVPPPNDIPPEAEDSDSEDLPF